MLKPIFDVIFQRLANTPYSRSGWHTSLSNIAIVWRIHIHILLAVLVVNLPYKVSITSLKPKRACFKWIQIWKQHRQQIWIA
ncbi:hypothetical protein BGZ90_006870, partial [Linnemannia elongata]